MKYVFCDGRVPSQIRERLCREGFTVLPMKKSACLSEAVCAHVDLSVLKIGEKLLVRDEVVEWFPFLCENRKVIVSKERPIPRYPEETMFCAKVVGGTLYHGKAVAQDALRVASEEGLATCEVKQGYVACSLLALDEKHAITSDKTITDALLSRGGDVLRIREGYISLAPYPYGFIGGACGVYKDCVYFLGDVRTHPDGKKIIDYLTACGFRYICLGEGELFDGGGLVFWEDTTLPVCENT